MRKNTYGLDNVDSYIDDIIVYTNGLKTHFQVLEIMFQHRDHAYLMAKAWKWVLGSRTSYQL